MYLELFRASEEARRLLENAQRRAEQELLRADPPPLELWEPLPGRRSPDDPPTKEGD